MNKDILKKYFIMGSQNCSRSPAAILEEAIKGGITAFQFREKGPDCLAEEKKIMLGKELRGICRKNGIPFFINDDVELAEELDVDGLHVGQDDLPVEAIREAFPDKWIGLSLSNEIEVNKSPLHLVDYIGAGPVFATPTKTDAKQTVGPEWITKLRKHFPDLPIVAIGGIQENNAAEVRKAGADGVAVISAITEAKSIETVIRNL